MARRQAIAERRVCDLLGPVATRRLQVKRRVAKGRDPSCDLLGPVATCRSVSRRSVQPC